MQYGLKLIPLLFAVAVLSSCKESASVQSTVAGDSSHVLRALIIDGQNNHGIWPKTSAMMKDYLEQTGLFKVDIARTAYTWQNGQDDSLLEKFPVAGVAVTKTEKPQADPSFAPLFANYDVVISNFGWMASPFPQATRDSLEAFVSNGGGLVVVHAADNSWPEWPAFNKMIALGGWGDRNEKDGPYVYYNDAGLLVRDTTQGPAGSHGKQHEFTVIVRDSLHPITQGMPTKWMHVQDELYERLRGPAENLHVLATAYSGGQEKSTNRHEPMLMTIDYGRGRVFHTPMGHADYSMSCVGFIVSLQRGAEWAATGRVTQSLPADFPGADKVSERKWGTMSNDQ
jgi:type 1 glutamine amidotransferase